MTDARCNCPPLRDVLRGHVIGTRPPCPVHPEPTFPPGTFVDHARTAGRATPPPCAWCGHVHDPQDGHCDAHANVGIGTCPCPGDDLREAYDKINTALYVAEQDCAELRGNLQAVMMDREVLRDRLAHVERLRQAGDRLAVCLRSSFNVDGYGSPEHEAACREALREWQWERRS